MVRIKMLACVAVVGLVTAALAGPARAEAVGGPKLDVVRVPAYGSVTYEVTFYGGAPAGVLVEGDGDTDLDLYIYDEGGHLVASDDDDTDRCVALWTPRWTGKFTIKIVNRGSVYNQATVLVR
jgi:hypothetical protein